MSPAPALWSRVPPCPQELPLGSPGFGSVPAAVFWTFLQRNNLVASERSPTLTWGNVLGLWSMLTAAGGALPAPEQGLLWHWVQWVTGQCWQLCPALGSAQLSPFAGSSVLGPFCSPALLRVTSFGIIVSFVFISRWVTETWGSDATKLWPWHSWMNPGMLRVGSAADVGLPTCPCCPNQWPDPVSPRGSFLLLQPPTRAGGWPISAAQTGD